MGIVKKMRGLVNPFFMYGQNLVAKFKELSKTSLPLNTFYFSNATTLWLSWWFVKKMKRIFIFIVKLKIEAQIPNVKEAKSMQRKGMRVPKSIKTHFNLSKIRFGKSVFLGKKVRLVLLSSNFSLPFK